MTFETIPSNRPAISAVVATYEGELAANLNASLESLIHQTYSPVEIIVVVDGPVAADQDAILDRARETSVVPVKIVRLPINGGRGHARNCGIAACSADFIALMDSDDVCLPDRLEVQSEFLGKNPDIDIVASWTQEFEDDDLQKQWIKFTPTSHRDIVKALRWSNCVANPTIVFRKSAWETVGMMPNFRQMNEDYLFFLRLYSAGFKFACIPKVLVRVRIDARQRQRRKGFRLLMEDLRFRWASYREGHLSLGTTAIGICLISARRLAPAAAQSHLQAAWRRLGRILYSKK
jgi:glycosyltransferase involved in cell wall biosynthesis